MGYMWSAYLDRDGEPAFNPHVYEKFEDTSRPIRKMIATTEEMDRAGLPRERRDYCAHLFMDTLRCRRDHFPMTWHCTDALHKYQHCTLDDHKLRIMEYERTRRLLNRERKRIANERRESLDE